MEVKKETDFYVVGHSEPGSAVFPGVFQTMFSQQAYTIENARENILRQHKLHIFVDAEEAGNYARSLRIQIPAKVENSGNRRLAPVFTCRFQDAVEHIFKISQGMKNKEIKYAIYENFFNNFSSGEEIRKVSFFHEKRQKLPGFRIISVSFPDTQINHAFDIADSRHFVC